MGNWNGGGLVKNARSAHACEGICCTQTSWDHRPRCAAHSEDLTLQASGWKAGEDGDSGCEKNVLLLELFSLLYTEECNCSKLSLARFVFLCNCCTQHACT